MRTRAWLASKSLTLAGRVEVDGTLVLYTCTSASSGQRQSETQSLLGRGAVASLRDQPLSALKHFCRREPGLPTSLILHRPGYGRRNWIFFGTTHVGSKRTTAKWNADTSQTDTQAFGHFSSREPGLPSSLTHADRVEVDQQDSICTFYVDFKRITAKWNADTSSV